MNEKRNLLRIYIYIYIYVVNNLYHPPKTRMFLKCSCGLEIHTNKYLKQIHFDAPLHPRRFMSAEDTFAAEGDRAI